MKAQEELRRQVASLREVQQRLLKQGLWKNPEGALMQKHGEDEPLPSGHQ